MITSPVLLAAFLLDVRFWLWRHLFVPLPARPGWRALVRDVVTTSGVYVGEGGALGAPFEWSMYARASTGAWEPMETMCAETGAAISPTSDPFGVRCARCGVPLAAVVAGMRTSLDVPSCRACRGIVRRAVRTYI